ncbi:MAG: hypothetical protein A2Z25_05900 [Planctomycetes bacterium RBG_16_55_9]|nr:MAG: hypothetical protein A2Z25_05900 [Planctomycetes bacterium RBG_16_55_9]
MKKQLTLCIGVNAAVMIFLSLYVLLVPAAILIYDLHDPGLSGERTPRCVFRWHRALSPRYEKWASQRVKAGAASKLTIQDISGTEWPVFGSVFYLWATEALQEAWDENPKPASSAPKDYARGAIEAAAALIADPNHASWIKDHWGDDYLEKENLFYRMLLIGGLTSYQKLSGKGMYEDLLRNQVESLAREIDESPYGLLDDYPGQCYPVDILPAIAAIRRADMVLGTNHSEFAARAIRGFQETRLDEHTGLPAYIVDSRTGRAQDSARGVGLSFMLIWAPELWPETTRDWYAKYEQQFWQRGRWLAGFREYPKDVDVGWLVFNDVDAGPVVCGYGAAACAFGVGAARAMGRPDHARALAAQAIVGSWPLPDGTLLGPRTLSNLSDAPYLGEAAVLFALTRKPVIRSEAIQRGELPWSVYAGILLGACVGICVVYSTIRKVRHWHKYKAILSVPAPAVQVSLWWVLMAAAVLTITLLDTSAGWIVLLAAQLLPFRIRTRNKKMGEFAAHPVNRVSLPSQ